MGVGMVLANSGTAFSIIKWLGAGYLGWLGFQALRPRPLNRDSVSAGTLSRETGVAGGAGPASAGMGAFAAFRSGLLTNLLNPKAPPFFLAVFTQVVRPGTPLWMQNLYGFTIIATGLLWFAVLAWVVSAQRVRTVVRAVAPWLERATGVALIGLGVRLALAQFSGE